MWSQYSDANFFPAAGTLATVLCLILSWNHAGQLKRQTTQLTAPWKKILTNLLQEYKCSYASLLICAEHLVPSPCLIRHPLHINDSNMGEIFWVMNIQGKVLGHIKGTSICHVTVLSTLSGLVTSNTSRELHQWSYLKWSNAELIIWNN